jgi:hypothetical protein
MRNQIDVISLLIGGAPGQRLQVDVGGQRCPVLLRLSTKLFSAS